MENAPKKFFRLGLNKEVRLRYAYYITCKEVIKDENGEAIELICTYDPETKGGNSPDGRKVKATLHWVSTEHAVQSEVRLYDRLFNKENPYEFDEGQSFLSNINPDSLKVISAYVEPFVKNSDIIHYQFERIGYFCKDNDSTPEKLVFNRTVALRDSWAKKTK